MTVYLLHFDRAYVGTRRNPAAQRTQIAQHYLGYAGDVAARIERHRSGQGARLIEVITQAGIAFTLAATWPGGRAEERRLKRQHHAARLCPICQQRSNSL
jgi:predicted GIY-YIG superfamily endonuclease